MQTVPEASEKSDTEGGQDVFNTKCDAIGCTRPGNIPCVGNLELDETYRAYQIKIKIWVCQQHKALMLEGLMGIKLDAKPCVAQG